MAAPLEGIRVIDFGRYIAAPYCGMVLADRLGEHTDAVLQEIGFTTQEIAKLRELEVV